MESKDFSVEQEAFEGLARKNASLSVQVSYLEAKLKQAELIIGELQGSEDGERKTE